MCFVCLKLWFRIFLIPFFRMIVSFVRTASHKVLIKHWFGSFQLNYCFILKELFLHVYIAIWLDSNSSHWFNSLKKSIASPIWLGNNYYDGPIYVIQKASCDGHDGGSPSFFLPAYNELRSRKMHILSVLERSQMVPSQ